MKAQVAKVPRHAGPGRLNPPASFADGSWADVFAAMDEVELSQRAPFSSAEWSVLQRVRRGLSNREIAAELGCPESAVKRHVSACLRKRGVRSRTRLIALGK